MKTYYLLSLILLIGCSAQKEKADGEEERSETTEVMTTTPVENEPGNSESESIVEDYSDDTPSFNYRVFDAVTVRSAASFDTPDLTSASSGSIPAGLLVDVAEKGDREASEGDDECRGAGYHWYAVSEGGDAPSWVYGADIYSRQKAEDYFNNNMSPDVDDFGYKIDKSFYRFDMAASTFEEPEDLEDPLECDIYAMPFLYIDTVQEVFPIFVPDELQSDLGYGLEANAENFLLLVLDSGYGSARIIDFNELDEGQFAIDIIRSTMDEAEGVNLSVREENGEFLMTGLSVR